MSHLAQGGIQLKNTVIKTRSRVKLQVKVVFAEPSKQPLRLHISQTISRRCFRELFLFVTPKCILARNNRDRTTASVKGWLDKRSAAWEWEHQSGERRAPYGAQRATRWVEGQQSRSGLIFLLIFIMFRFLWAITITVLGGDSVLRRPVVNFCHVIFMSLPVGLSVQFLCEYQR